MNFKKWTTALMLILTVTSCIQDEALNSEAAIDACTGADVQLAHINSDSKEINIYVHKGADLSKQQLLFTLPVGATLSADKHYPNDILNNYDFSNDSHSRTFTVTSEDGEWTATYTVKSYRQKFRESSISKTCFPLPVPNMTFSTSFSPAPQPMFPACCNGQAAIPVTNLPA